MDHKMHRKRKDEYPNPKIFWSGTHSLVKGHILKASNDLSLIYVVMCDTTRLTFYISSTRIMTINLYKFMLIRSNGTTHSVSVCVCVFFLPFWKPYYSLGKAERVIRTVVRCWISFSRIQFLWRIKKKKVCYRLPYNIVSCLFPTNSHALCVNGLLHKWCRSMQASPL